MNELKKLSTERVKNNIHKVCSNNEIKKKAVKYIDDNFTHEQIDRILDLACRRLIDNYGQEAPIDKNEKILWFELFYKWCAGYNGKKLRDM